MSQAVARLSDRALARIVGANAYLRGRVYARQQMVHDMAIDGGVATSKVHGRASDPYDVRLDVNSDGAFTSQCSCPAWRGPERHCKHVAALLVALRDKYRSPRAQAAAEAAALAAATPGASAPAPTAMPSLASSASSGASAGGGKSREERRFRRGRRDEPQGPREVVVVDRSGPRVVSASGPATVQAVSAGPAGDGRAGFEIWLPRNESRRPPEFEYRLQLRSQSIAMTVISTETRAAITAHDAYEALGAHVSPHRVLLHQLMRLAPRSQRINPIEARGEDAAELISKLRGRRVLLEPALMELRYLDEPLYPRMEVELVPHAIRVRVVFERKGDGRRFNLSQGLWLEGMPGWHLDPTQGVARQIADCVTPPWLERLSRAPAITHPLADIGRLLGDIVPRVSLSLNAPLPDINTIVDIVDATPTFILRAVGDLVNVRATLKASYGEIELDVPPVELPPPLAIIPGDSARPRCVRRDIGAERAAVEKLLELRLEVTEDFTAFRAEGDEAVSFWTEGIGSLPDDWDRFIPNDLVDVTVRDTPVSARARVSSGVDWLSLDVEFGSEGTTVTENDLRMALLEGHRLVKLADGTYAPIARGEVQDVLNRMAEIFAGGKKKLPLSQAGRVQDLMRALEHNAQVAPAAREFFDKLGGVHKVPHIPVPKKLTATMRP
ncbi:MAG: SWIM zinc finger family protein, partial [Deltaproteobacteria bacterium]